MRSVLLAALLVAAMSQTNTSQVPAQNAERAQGTLEGVQVHGDWIIEVRNPDGTLAHRHAFKNALVGGPLLGAIMARKNVPGGWYVRLVGDACQIFSQTTCILDEISGNLTVGLSPSGNEIVLTGTVTANNPLANVLEQVITGLDMCGNFAVPSTTCTPINWATFSSKTLPSPIPITFNQMAIVTVTFSFS